jgi:hypothetical protein
LGIKFFTQNTNEVIYSGHLDESTTFADSKTPRKIDWSTDGPTYHTYRGFLFYYAFFESPGDCYFQMRRNFMCGYENIAGPKWTVVGDVQAEAPKDMDEIEFQKHFCTNCYLSAHIPLQSEQPAAASLASILASPVIQRSMLALQFDYRLMNGATLLVILIHNHDYMERQFDRSVLLKKVTAQTAAGNAWSRVRVKLGNHMLHNFRVLFSLEKTGVASAPMVHLDNIQFFEHDYECAQSMDEQSCTRVVASGNEFCQKYSMPCEMGQCMNGALCLNRDQIEPHLMLRPRKQLVDNQEDEYSCVCAHGFTGKR